MTLSWDLRPDIVWRLRDPVVWSCARWARFVKQTRRHKRERMSLSFKALKQGVPIGARRRSLNLCPKWQPGSKFRCVPAGGIVDGQGLAAALESGAQGVVVGTAFLATEESFAHDYHKKRIVEARPSETLLKPALSTSTGRVEFQFAYYPTASHGVSTAAPTSRSGELSDTKVTGPFICLARIRPWGTCPETSRPWPSMPAKEREKSHQSPQPLSG